MLVCHLFGHCNRTSKIFRLWLFIFSLKGLLLPDPNKRNRQQKETNGEEIFSIQGARVSEISKKKTYSSFLFKFFFFIDLSK